jgi:hypothetical protein
MAAMKRVYEDRQQQREDDDFRLYSEMMRTAPVYRALNALLLLTVSAFLGGG